MNCTFRKIEKKDFVKILELRNQLKVRKASLNSKKISRKEHFDYLNLNLRKSLFIYKLVYNKKIIGIANGLVIKKAKNFIRWGIYKDFSARLPFKVGSVLLFNLIETFFKRKDINNLRCEVLKNNKLTRKWYIRWGCEINKNYVNKKYYVLDLKKIKWQKIRKQIKENLQITLR